MLLPLLLLVQETTTLDAAVAAYRAKTAAEIPCKTTDDQQELVVCARRVAYRYQLPLVPAYDARNDANDQEARIQTREAQGIVKCGEGAFMVKCGAVGVSMTVGLGDGATRYAARPLP